MMTMDNAHLSKVLKEATKGGKATFGIKESISVLKGSKAILVTHPVAAGRRSKLVDEAKRLGIPVVELPQSSVELAKMIGRPYPISAVALRSVSEGDLNQLLK